MIKLLLERGANPHFQMRKKKSHVLIAASMPNLRNGDRFIDPEVIQLLLDHKVDITVKRSDGKGAYDFMKENEEFKKTDLFKNISKKFESVFIKEWSGPHFWLPELL